MKPKVSVTRLPDYDENGHWCGYDRPFPAPGTPAGYKCGTGCWLVRVTTRDDRDAHGMIEGMADLVRNPGQARHAAAAWLKKYAKRKVGHHWAREHCRRFRFSFAG